MPSWTYNQTNVDHKSIQGALTHPRTMLVNLDVVCVQCAAGCQSQWTKSLKNQGQKNPEIKMVNQFHEIIFGKNIPTI